MQNSKARSITERGCTVGFFGIRVMNYLPAIDCGSRNCICVPDVTVTSHCSNRTPNDRSLDVWKIHNALNIDYFFWYILSICYLTKFRDLHTSTSHRIVRIRTEATRPSKVWHSMRNLPVKSISYAQEWPIYQVWMVSSLALIHYFNWNLESVGSFRYH